jgi:sucrose-6-phosphate hydrolase SacC (GH32 family)
MRYAPPGLCLNDFTLLGPEDGGEEYAVLHLQGPWTDRFDHLRMETSFGRATSADLVEWLPQGPVFGVGLPGRFDRQAVFTMHSFRYGEGLAMLYTGVEGLTLGGWPVQSVGLAWSDRTDGTAWRRHGTEPVVRADPRWYRTGEEMGWRDPFVVRDDEDAGWAMVICASDASLPVEVSGCVGFAVSADLEHWEVRPPLISPGDVDQLECPVLERMEGGGWLLLGCVHRDARAECWTAPGLSGPWRRLGPVGPATAYAPRAITAPDGTRVLVHTAPRRIGLRDSGALCRGMLAQPKALVAHPGEPARMEWWNGLDAWLEEPTDQPLRNAVGDIEVTGSLEAVLRADQDGPVLTVGCTAQRIRLTCGVRREEAVAREPVRRLRVLTVGEYVEVYADGVFVLQSSCYAGRPVPWTVAEGGRTHRVPVRPVRLPEPPRDDASAIWPG